MTPRALTVEQAERLQSLVIRKRLRVVPIDPNKAERFLDQAHEALREISKIEGAKLKHGIAYDVAHDVGEALIAAYGYATTNGSGQHQTIGEVIAIVFLGTEGEGQSEVFEQIREERNQIRYRSSSIGLAQAESAINCGEILLAIAQKILE